MRLKTLVLYNLSTTKSPIIIFYTFFMGGTLFGSIISSVAYNVTMGVRNVNSEGIIQTWSSSILAFVIFMLISSLIGSQKESRFLITRSVSRKEIFFSNAVFMVALAAVMSVLQIVGITIDAAVRNALGSESAFRGLELDIQSLQAPDMKSIPVFFIVSFSIMLCVGALGYLLGSCMARWKMQTIGVMVVGFMVLIACLVLPDFFKWLTDAFKFMFTDEKTGLYIALKQTAFAILVMALSMPVMRRITAAKQM